jgi:DNA-binding transcriptional LysR family regulator
MIYAEHKVCFGMRGLNLDHLRSFADVIARGSFSAAAEHAGLTQPAISQHVRQLEKRLGVRLIERVGRRATPTAAGMRLLAHAEQIGAAVDGALADLARHEDGGRVRLGTGATACIYLLPAVLRELRRRYPALEIIVSTGNTVDIVKAVESNTLDIGLVTMPASGRALDVTPILEDEFVAIAATSDRPLPRVVSPAALARRPVLLFEPGGNTRQIVDRWLARTRQPLTPVMALGSVEAIKELVGAGLGCAVLPSMAVRTQEARRRLVVRPLSPRLHRKLAIVLRRDKPLTRGLRAMVDALRGLADR